MKVKATFVSKVAAWLLGTINFVVMAFCLLWFSLSLWMISSPNTMSHVIQQLGSKTLNALLPPSVMTIQNGVGSAALSLFIFFIAFMGLYGAVSRSQFLLFMYSTLVLLLLLLECALIYYFSSNLIEKGLQEEDGQWTHAMRLLFRCCDTKNVTQDALKPPWSCCGSDYYPDNCTVINIYKQSCQTAITEWIHHNISVIYTTLAILHLLLASCSIVRRSRCASHSQR